MQRSTMLLCLVAALAALVPQARSDATGTPPKPWETTFAMIAAQGARNQWALTTAYADSEAGPFTTKKCPSPVYGACWNSTQPVPFNTPMLAMGDGAVQVTYTFTKTGLTMYNRTSQIPTTIKFKLCYSNVAFANRAWRKKNKPYPGMTSNCGTTAYSMPFPSDVQAPYTTVNATALSGSIIIPMKEMDKLVSATYFYMMWLVCSDGNVCAFESTESPTNATTGAYIQPYNGNYIQTDGYNPMPTGMIVGASILAAIGPIFFLVYFFLDQAHFKKTGKALAW